MILVIRGTNGSGKSHTVRQIIAQGRQFDCPPKDSSLIKIKHVNRPVLVVGPYTEERSMGGCDCLRQPRRIYELIHFAQDDVKSDRLWHVLLEGVVLATKPYLDLYRAGYDVRFAWLDPSMKNCLENIAKRQAKKGHVSVISRSAMDGKRARARDAYEQYIDAGMIAARFTRSEKVVRWILYQLRNP